MLHSQACPRLSSDILLEYNRFRCELTRGIRDDINRLGIRRRSCRAGAHCRCHRAGAPYINNNNNNNDNAASRSAVCSTHRISVILSTRPRHSSLPVCAGRRDPRLPVRRSVESIKDIPVIISDRPSSRGATRASSAWSSLLAAGHRSQRSALVRVRCSHPPSVITIGQLNARSIGNKSVAINDLIVDHRLDL